MEDDDEFGDLYTDVLRPFSSSLSPGPPPHNSSPAPPPPRPLIDLNHVDDKGDVREDVKEIPYGAPNQNSAGGARVLSSPDSRLPNSAKNPEDLPDKDINFDIEEGDTETAQDPGAMSAMIPGLMDADSRRNEADVSRGPGRGGDDWDEEEDSDSEDDLQIVLNDNTNNTHGGPMLIGVGGDDDNDEDEGPLVIVADGDPNQGMEEQDWGVGEDAGVVSALGAVGPEGERKEGGEGAPVGAAGRGNAVLGQKIGYSSHGYHHPFHSQFKYVRPGAAPIPGAGPAGAPGQLRPSITMAPMAGRGRGDWRPSGIKGVPPMQKNFHPGFGMPWGNNTAGRGLEFTLPSHKTIFDVDIDGFEERPWKYPGADMTDFFNFGLNEESWKDYCKQLEQYRLETTMQSKIRVYESGRAEKEYDPEMPPELAAATGAHDGPADNANSAKSGVGQTDLTKGSTRARPPIPTGRAIQVEAGYGERLPSIDTRPPRIRDSDAIIEIVLQDSLDDPSAGVVDGVDDKPLRDELRGGHGAEDDMPHRETEYLDDLPHSQNSQKGGRRTPFMNPTRNHIPEEDEIVPFRSETPTQHHSGSRDQPSSYSGGDDGSPRNERRTQGGTHDNSPHLTSSRGRQDKRFTGNVEEESVESMDSKCNPLLSSPATARDVREMSNDEKDDTMPDELVHAEGSSGMERDEMTGNEVATTDTFANGNEHKFSKREKITSLAEQPALQELDDFEDSKAARSSENSKARSGSSKDYQKWQDGVDDEVVQGGRSTRTDSVKRNFDENEQDSRRKDCDVRHEMDRNRMVIRSKEGVYPHRDVDPGLSQQFHKKSEGYERRKERENLNGPWQRRDEDPHSRKGRSDDKKRERGDETGTRHRSKTREDERTNKDEHLHLKKQLDNGNYRIHHDKEGSSRYREREDSVKSRYEVVDDYHSKRRKDEEFLRKDHTNKEEILLSHREITGRRRRERDDVLDPRKRDDQQRIRENLDDYHSARHKDDIWLQRERGERQREEFYRLKQSHDENLSKREREEGRGSVRSGRVDDKAWVGHARVKDEYKVPEKLKDAARSSEHPKRRDRMDDDGLSHHRGRDDVYVRGNQFNNDERRPRQVRSSTRIERSVDAPDNQRAHERKHKESIRKSKDSEGGDYSTSGTSKRNQDGQVGRTDEMGLQRTSEPGIGVKTAPAQRNSSKRRKEDASSDEEQQDSKRGRSKLERWTSHTERDYSISNKTSATIKFKEIDRNNNGGSSEASRLPDEAPKKVEVVEKHPTGEEKDAGDTENKDSDGKPLEDWHLDTVEKLKKRSERFKLPLTSEKDTVVIKNMESEPPPPVKTEVPPDSEIKAERPPRKRRWISS